MGEVFIYARNAGGGRNIGVDLDGVRVLVESHGEETDQRAERIARSIAERHDANVVAEAERAEHRHKVKELQAMVDRAHDRVASARSALASLVNGRRRFFGPVLCVPGSAGWDGEVWLLDPEKRERGFGLRFESLSNLRESHPELWIVRPEADGILLDVCPIHATGTKPEPKPEPEPKPCGCEGHPFSQPQCDRHKELHERALRNGMPPSGRWA